MTHIKYYLITNNPSVAAVAEATGVDRLFVDLETHGKQARQAGRDTVISYHTLRDVEQVRAVLETSQLLVRINPLHTGSRAEIQRVIDAGADIIMLPYFRTADEVSHFIDLVAGRTPTILLLETQEAMCELDAILSVSGNSEFHIGLNDLHLSLAYRFIFEPLIDGVVEAITSQLKNHAVPYGIGGVGRIGQGVIPAELVLTEYIRLGASATILSRSFTEGLSPGHPSFEPAFHERLTTLRREEANIRNLEEHTLQQRRQLLEMHVARYAKDV